MKVIAPISTYLQRLTCFTDYSYIIIHKGRGEGAGQEEKRGGRERKNLLLFKKCRKRERIMGRI